MVGYLAVTMLSMMGADLGSRYACGAAPGSATVVTGVQLTGTVNRLPSHARAQAPKVSGATTPRPGVHHEG